MGAFMAALPAVAGKAAVGTAASMGVEKGANALFGADTQNMPGAQADPAAGHSQMQAQLLMSIMQALQQQQQQPQQQQSFLPPMGGGFNAR